MMLRASIPLLILALASWPSPTAAYIKCEGNAIQDACSNFTNNQGCDEQEDCYWDDPNCIPFSICEAKMGQESCENDRHCTWVGIEYMGNCIQSTQGGCLHLQDKAVCQATPGCKWVGMKNLIVPIAIVVTIVVFFLGLTLCCCCRRRWKQQQVLVTDDQAAPTSIDIETMAKQSDRSCA